MRGQTDTTAGTRDAEDGVSEAVVNRKPAVGTCRIKREYNIGENQFKIEGIMKGDSDNMSVKTFGGSIERRLKEKTTYTLLCIWFLFDRYFYVEKLIARVIPALNTKNAERLCENFSSRTLHIFRYLPVERIFARTQPSRRTGQNAACRRDLRGSTLSNTRIAYVLVSTLLSMLCNN